jgi:hypothetical protein
VDAPLGFGIAVGVRTFNADGRRGNTGTFTFGDFFNLDID